jgi:glycosyltransferase involved in cell wall biosynthesis
VAKHGYVAASTGWFSDRSACYLASGRPVVALDTGLGSHFELGEGLLVGNDADELADAIDRVSADPDRHGRAARRFAEQHLSADAVCASLVARA